MKKSKSVFLGLTTFALSSVLSASLVTQHAFQSVNYNSVPRNVAQTAPATFEDAKSYYLANVNSNSVAVASWVALANEIINDHLKSAQGKGGIVLMNNVGPSDGDFKDKEQIQRLAKTETIQLAQQLLAQSGGGTIVVMAGNTNTGVGNIVTAVQDPAFVSHVEKTYNVRVVTAGLSAYHAALNHGPYEAGKNGPNFMNTKLNYTALIPTAPDAWTVKLNGISSVVHISANFNDIAQSRGIVNSQSVFVLREGGPIAIEEGTMMLTELDRKARESGKSPQKITKIIMQQGIQSGVARGEIKANKGTAGVTDLLLSLSRMAAKDPQFKSTLESLKIELQRFNSAGVLSFKGELTSETINKTLQMFQASEEGKQILEKAKKYVDDVKAAMKGENAAEKIAAIDRNLGIRSAGDLKTIDMSEVNNHKIAARVRALANSYIAYMQAINDISNAYSENAKSGKVSAEAAKVYTEAAEKLKSSAEKALSIAQLEIKDGKVVRSIVTETGKAIEKAKK